MSARHVPTLRGIGMGPWVIWAAEPLRFWRPLLLSIEADEAHALARLLRRSCPGQRYAVRRSQPPLTPNQ